MAVRVTNKNQQVYRDRFDGIDYVFEPNKPVVVEDERALAHFFGYGMDQEYQLKRFGRNGWLKMHDEAGLASAWATFGGFKFEAVQPKWEDQLDDAKAGKKGEQRTAA